MPFTVEQIGTCGCGKPVTHQIVGHPGNIDYGKACAKCGKAKAARLEAAGTVPR